MQNNQPIFKVQSYLVKCNLGNPVDVNINIYHEFTTPLTREEILEEAFDYAAESGIILNSLDVVEIETLEFVPLKPTEEPQNNKKVWQK